MREIDNYYLNMGFPRNRPRRLRLKKAIREAVSRVRLDIEDLIAPIFVDENISGSREIRSMPGVSRWSIDRAIEELSGYLKMGLNKILVFGIPGYKDDFGSSAYDKDGVVQRTIREIRSAFGDGIVLFTDICLCQYTTHGHCGVVAYRDGKLHVENDKSLDLMSKIAVSHAEAGADFVAPSSMLDGVVGAIRRALDEHGYADVGIMSYSVKYASLFYGPFREAAESAPKLGDRRGYQMDPRSSEEAIKEAFMDIAEGADILMVKPALPYLDIIRILRDSFGYMPIAAYNVSGEYSLVKAASSLRWVDGKGVTYEIMTSIKRAGADLIISYHAPEVAEWIMEGYKPF